LNSLGTEGRWVIYGAMGGSVIEKLNMAKFLVRRAQILSSTLRARSDSYKADLIKSFSENVVPKFESGELRVIVDKTFPMS